MGMYEVGSPCPLCGQPRNKDDDLIGFGFFAMSDPAFSLLDDSVVHRACLDAWERRDDFIAYHNKLSGPSPSRPAGLGQLLVVYDGSVRYQSEADALELGKHVASCDHRLAPDEIVAYLQESSESPWDAATLAMSKGIIEDELHHELMYLLCFQKHFTREEFRETDSRLEEQRGES